MGNLTTKLWTSLTSCNPLPPKEKKKGKDLQCPYKIIKLICNNGKYTSKFQTLLTSQTLYISHAVMIILPILFTPKQKCYNPVRMIYNHPLYDSSLSEIYYLQRRKEKKIYSPILYMNFLSHTHLLISSPHHHFFI